jgi:hypothetical protein
MNFKIREQKDIEDDTIEIYLREGSRAVDVVGKRGEISYLLASFDSSERKMTRYMVNFHRLNIGVTSSFVESDNGN